MFSTLKCFALLLFVGSCFSTNAQLPRQNTAATSSDAILARDSRNLLTASGKENSWSLFRLPRCLFCDPCAWNEPFEQCFVSEPKLARFLENFGGDYATLLLARYDCQIREDQASCETGRTCYWDNDLNICELGDFVTAFGSSPCVTAAPRYFRHLKATVACSKLDNYKSCQWNDECRWDPDDRVCLPRTQEIYYDVEPESEQVKQVYDAKFNELLDLIESDPSVLSQNSTWDTILQWKIPQTACSNQVRPQVCDYVQAYLSVIAPAHFYCRWRYPASILCDKDPYCKYGDLGVCGISKSVKQAAEVAAAKVIIARMPDSADKYILSKTFECREIEQGEKCTGTGYCFWYPLWKTCSVKKTYIRAAIANAGKALKDPVCSFYNAGSQSLCEYQLDKKACKETGFCRWSSTNRCYTSEEYFVAGAVSFSAEINRRYIEQKQRCATAIFEATCARTRTAT